jgi:hypothetical protein
MSNTPEFLACYLDGYGSFGRAKPDYSRCAKKVANSGRWPSFHQCNRRNGNGKHGAYCKQHDPDAVKAKRDAESANRKAKYDFDCRNYAFVTDCKDAVRQIAAGHNDPRALCQSIIDNLEAKP